MASEAEVATAASLGPLIERWYSRGGRDFPWRHWDDRYRLLVAEVLLQRTSARVVLEFLPGFLDEYPDARSLAFADVAVLARRLEPLGLSSRRAHSLSSLASTLVNDPGTADADLPGVGQYIERSVRVAMHAEPVAMVDSNFVRIVMRVFGGRWMSDYRYDQRLQDLSLAMVKGGSDPRAVNWGVLDLGAMVCKPRTPICTECPLLKGCGFAARQVPARRDDGSRSPRTGAATGNASA